MGEAIRGLASVDAKWESPHRIILSRWGQSEVGIELNVRVPVGLNIARIGIPCSNPDSAEVVATQSFCQLQTAAKEERAYVKFRVGSGVHTLRCSAAAFIV